MQKVSLITYNIHKGFGVAKMRFLLPQMRAALTELNPNFVFLQEVQGRHSRREKRIQHWPDLPQFEYMAELEWAHFLYARNAIYQSGHHGNAILSKYTFNSFENINLSTHNRASRSILHGQITLQIEGRPITLHLLCVHLGLFKKERAFQCDALIQRIYETIPVNEPLIMAGDFNDWRNHLSGPLADTLGLEEAFFNMHGELALTFPSIRPTLRVDRIYFRGLHLRKAIRLHGRPWRTLSDHLPLYAEFDITI